MKKLAIIFICGLWILPNLLFSQTDREFWFAAPDVSSVHGNNPWNGAPLNLHITAVYSTHVVIDRPADTTFTPIEVDLDAMDHYTLRLDDILPIDEIETYPQPDLIDGVQQTGFRITADPGEITAYYEMDQYWNRDIMALKGKNALGKDFWIHTQNHWPNGDYSGTAWSGFVICATKNNTVVTIYQNDGWLHFPTAATRTVTLDAGETFAFRAASRDAIRHINGVHVTATENIVITTYDDSMHKTPEGCRDIFADQTVPTNIIGTEYIVMEGYLNAEERFFVMAIQNGTQVYVDDVLKATIDEGEIYHESVTKRATHVRTSVPSYVNHLTGFGCEMGGAVLPTIDGCTGSNDVTFTRTNNTIDAFYLNIMVRNDTTDASPFKNQSVQNFTLEVDGTVTPIPSNYFDFIQDSVFAVLKDEPAVHTFFTSRIGPGDEAQVSNSTSRFHLGVINGGAGTGCKYGYFSDYAASKASAGIGGATAVTQQIYCNLDPIRLVASGGIAYDWSGVSDYRLTQQLSDSTEAAPYFYADTTGDFIFKVKIFGECFTDTTIYMLARFYIGPTSDFEFSENEGCSPFTPVITNLTNSDNADKMIWAFNDPYQEVNQDTIPTSFDWTFPANNSDTLQTHVVRLYSFAPYNSCPSIREKTVKVKPYVGAAFEASDTIGCQPLTVNLNNLSTGHLDSTSYYWDFGDYSQSFEESPAKSYYNFSLSDSVYTIRLITESPFECTDTAYQDIYVHPRVRANLTIDTASSCSPLITNLNPGNSVGVDTLIWSVDYFYADSIYKATNKNTITLQHQDTSVAAGPDTLYVQLTGANRFGCYDTLAPYRLVAYPEVTSDFTVDTDVICDSMPVLFTNNSVGYQLHYEWTFGDGRVYQDTTGADFSKYFFNRSDADTIFTVNLHSTSGYFCQSDFSRDITIHPYINADFGLEYLNNCTPLDATISNTSIRAHDHYWDFGDGNTSTTSLASFPYQFWNPLADRDTTYLIKLVVENNEGCLDSLTRTLNVYPQVVAGFDISESAGCSPLDVIFTNNSSGSLYYLWEFGDDVSSTNSNPNFLKTYNNFNQNDTNYVIQLTAVNSLGCDSILTDTVKVLASIDANYSLPLADSCSPFIIHPRNLSSSGAKVYRWDFGPLGTRSEFEPNLPPFTNTGFVEDTITTRLVVFGADDAEHRACADTHSIKVVVYPELSTSFLLDNNADCQPLIANINNTTNIIPSTTFQWRLNNNFYSSSAAPPALALSNFSESDSVYNLKVYGATKFGCRDTADQDLTVYAHVNAKFTLDRPAICSGDSIYVDRSSTSGGITSYQWNFNGESGSSSSDPAFWHSYTNTISPVPLNKYVTLTVENSHGCDSSWTETVLVNPKVTAAFTPDQIAFCYPHTSTFTNNSINANTYVWDFTDGVSSTEAMPDHQFENFSKTEDKTFNVQLIARSQYNCYDSIRVPMTVYAKPFANYTLPLSVSCPPFDLTTVNLSEGSNLSYNWDFAGEGTSNESEPEFTFNNLGNQVAEKSIELVITSDRSCTDTLSKTARVYPGVEVSFTASTNEGCSPLQVDFSGDTVNATQMLWYLDGAPFSNLRDASYRFVNDLPENKQYSIKFLASSPFGCQDSTQQEITVFPTPRAEFIPDPVPTVYNTEEDQTPITFYNETVFRDTWSYLWDYGDGNSNNESGYEFVHKYGDHFWGDINNDSKIRVKLKAWNTENQQCRDSVEYDIIIKPPFPEIDLAEDIEQCAPFTVDFSSITKYIYEDQYEWHFGIPGETSTETEPTYTYTEPGVYTVKLVVRGDGGTNWDDKIITVHPNPEVNFAFNDSVVMVRSQLKGHDIINFYNHTRYGLNYSWDFGDGTVVDSVAEPTHYYEETGEYYVTLTAVSDKGCVSSLVHPTPITVLGEGYIEFPTGFFVDPSGPHDEYSTDQGAGNYYVFYPAASGVEEYRLEIYNRWGVLVFESKDVNRGWNGYIDGKPAKQDVYIWKVKGRFTNGQPFESAGDVTLISNKAGNIP